MNKIIYQAAFLLILVVFTPFSSQTTLLTPANNPQVTPTFEPVVRPENSSSAENRIYLPLLLRNSNLSSLHQSPRINVPFFQDTVKFPEAAVHWFGFVREADNYSDIRIGYTQNEIAIQLSVFDRHTWYDTNPALNSLTQWDAASIFLDTTGRSTGAPGANSFRFVGQLNWWEARTDYQAAYRGSPSGWVYENIQFTTETGARGIWNDNTEADRGWKITYHIPFSSLNLPSPPDFGSRWNMAVILYDRDDSAGQAISSKLWPEGAQSNLLATWGQIHFGLPSYYPPSYTNRYTYTIRHKLNGIVVPDAAVGGGTTCGSGLNYWRQWGDTNYAHQTQINIQNQSDVADWPCFSKYYLTFPLTGLPANKVVVSATLYMHQFGNADPTQAKPSLIQVYTIGKNWDEANLTWNNAPLAVENISRAWVEPLSSLPPWPGVPIHWDVSAGATQAYRLGTPLRLALYSADGANHSGKYFSSSDVENWNEDARPTLIIVLGDP